MAYIKDEFIFPNSVEVEIKWAGNYGAKGEKRASREKATPEQIKKQNQWNREKEYRRRVKMNFKKGDYWNTLLYPAGTKKTLKEVQKDMSDLIGAIRREYKKSEIPFKWIYRIEIGSRGGIHVHMICNEIRGKPIDMIMQERWHAITDGRVHFERFQGDEDSANKIGNYIAKELTEQQENKCEELGLSRKDFTKISCSRNLDKPQHVRKKYSHWTMKKVVDAQMPTARAGYIIDKPSVYFGTNPFTGLSYLYYTELKDEGGDTG